MEHYSEAKKQTTDMQILGLFVNPVGVNEVHDYISKVIENNQKALVINVNIHAVVLTLKNSWMHEFLRSAHLVFCDGDGVGWGLKILGYDPPPKVATTRWIWQLCEFSEKKRFRLFFLGTKQEIIEKAVRRLKSKFSALEVATHHGYFEKEGPENEKVVQITNDFSPDILLVGFGMPLQEKWVMQNWRKIQSHVFLKGGAVFDYVAGHLGEVPQWMMDRHLEWLFRIVEEPGRLFLRYLHDIPVFFFQVFAEKFKKGLLRSDGKQDKRNRLQKDH